MPCVTKGVTTDRKFHYFDKPLGYLGQLVGDDEMLYADFSHVHIAVRGVPFVALKPVEVNRESTVTRLQEVTDVSHSDEIFTDVTDEDIVIAFALPQAFSAEAHAWFSEASIIHVISALIMYEIKYSRAHTEPVMLLNVSSQFTELILCHQGQLLFVNHYRTLGPEDVLYYALAILQNLHLQSEHVIIKCAGTAATHALPVLQTYMPHTELFSFPDINPRSDYPNVETIDLICVSKCAS